MPDKAENQFKYQLRRLRPEPGDLLVFHNVPEATDMQKLIGKMEKSGSIPKGVGTIILPEGWELDKLNEEELAALGLQKINSNVREKEDGEDG